MTRRDNRLDRLLGRKAALSAPERERILSTVLSAHATDRPRSVWSVSRWLLAASAVPIGATVALGLWFTGGLREEPGFQSRGPTLIEQPGIQVGCLGSPSHSPASCAPGVRVALRTERVSKPMRLAIYLSDGAGAFERVFPSDSGQFVLEAHQAAQFLPATFTIPPAARGPIRLRALFSVSAMSLALEQSCIGGGRCPDGATVISQTLDLVGR